jgi:hypothetical protein
MARETILTPARRVLDSFDLLTEMEKRQVVSEILRRATWLGAPGLSDEELVLTAEEVFLELDRSESQNE